jgi:hypothetical protein
METADFLAHEREAIVDAAEACPCCCHVRAATMIVRELAPRIRHRG